MTRKHSSDADRGGTWYGACQYLPREANITLAQIDAHVSDNAPHMTGRGTEHEYRVEKGDFVAVVEPYAGRYSFSVRDIRRERPTIHGYGVDFPHAVIAVSQLLYALTGEHCRPE